MFKAYNNPQEPMLLRKEWMRDVVEDFSNLPVIAMKSFGLVSSFLSKQELLRHRQVRLLPSRGIYMP